MARHPTDDQDTAASASGDLLLTAQWVLPISAAPIADGAVRVRGARIRSVGSRAELAGPARERIDLGAAALLPGFVNVHTHLELTLLRGLYAGCDFVPWLRELVRAKYEVLEKSDFEAGAWLGGLQAVRCGVTTVGDAGDQRVVAGVLAASGLRGIAFQEVFGPDPAQCAASLAGLVEALAEEGAHASERIALGVSPHAPHTVSARLFAGVVEHALAERLPVSVHVAESRAETVLIRQGDGPFADHLRSRGIAWRTRSRSSVAYLDELGVLAAHPLVVHAIETDAEDRELLAERGCAVAHCPRSNANLGNGVAPLVELVSRGIAVGLGTDSAASGDTCDLIEEARCAAYSQRARRDIDAAAKASLGARELLALATWGGARVLGLDTEIGTLDAGKRADLVAVDLSGAASRPVHDPAAVIVFAAAGGGVVFTMVDGVALLRDGCVMALDEEAILARAEERAATIRARLRSHP